MSGDIAIKELNHSYSLAQAGINGTKAGAFVTVGMFAAAVITFAITVAAPMNFTAIDIANCRQLTPVYLYGALGTAVLTSVIGISTLLYIKSLPPKEASPIDPPPYSWGEEEKNINSPPEEPPPPHYSWD